jgi:hypothetical protein
MRLRKTTEIDMFYGYQSEEEMRLHHPLIADQLVSIAEKKEMTVCTPGKQCVGSLDGKEFMYADGSKDFGVTVTHFRVSFKGFVVRWRSNVTSEKQSRAPSSESSR